MPIPAPVFYLFAVMAIAFSLVTIFHRNPVSSAFSLVLVFFSFAGIYALLGAHLVAALQIIVYAGAVMVLFLFVIMLLNADAPSFDLGRSHGLLKTLAGGGIVVLTSLFFWVFRNSPVPETAGPFPPEKIEALGGNTRVVSQLLFSEYLLPFEMTSFLLLAGIVGAVSLAKRRPRGQGGKS